MKIIIFSDNDGCARSIRGNCDTYKQAVTKWNEMTKGKTND